jgi:hypothetical protein
MATTTTDDGLRAAMSMPVGVRFELLLIAYLKRVVLLPGPAAARLEMLELLERIDLIAPAVRAAIEPATNETEKIIREAAKLDPPEPDATHGAASYRLLTSDRVFAMLVALNPSIGKALKNSIDRGQPCALAT